jgi:RNA polymerase sigma factor (TIGR02999 family)
VANNPGDITQLLGKWRRGDPDAESRLFELLLPDLRKMARRYFRAERAGHTLQPTALVNEAFLRLVSAKGIDWQDRGHFFAVAARMMRRYLIYHAKNKPSVAFVEMEGIPERGAGGFARVELTLAVDALLNELEKESPQRRSVVELKFFLDLSDEDAAQALNLSLHTFQREWYRARRWLFERLNANPCKEARGAAAE